MTSLKPEPRPDRNGKLVTRWVRDDPTVVRSSIPAPAPVLSPRADKETMVALEEFFENCEITASFPFAVTMRRNVSVMSQKNAKNLVHALWEDFSAYGNYSAVGLMVDRIYGEGSVVAPEHRDTVFENFTGILPPYEMTGNSENERIIPNTMAVFVAVGGENIASRFTEDEQAVYTAAAYVTNDIFHGDGDDLDDLESNGFVRNEDTGELSLNGQGAIGALFENINMLEIIRERLADRRTLHPDAIHEIASAGVLGDGVL